MQRERELLPLLASLNGCDENSLAKSNMGAERIYLVNSWLQSIIAGKQIQICCIHPGLVFTR